MHAPLGVRNRAFLALIAVLAVLAGLVAVLPAAAAPTPSTGQPALLARLRAQVHAGTLLRTHGVRPVCATCHSLVVTESKHSRVPLSTKRPAGYGPRDLARAYHLPVSNRGAHTTIAIIDAGVDPKLESDLAVYRTQYGLPACTTAGHCLRLLDYLGGRQRTPTTTRDGRYVNEEVAVETSLDMDEASAGCPSCRLIEIALPWQDAVENNDVSTGDFVRAVRTAVRAGAKVISISYGYTADARNTSGAFLSAMTRRGIAIVASSGDSGFNGGAHQAWPSDLRSVIAVGGTTLPATGAQTAWSGAGSGCETEFLRAAGQPRRIAALCGGHRAASDISSVADPSTGLAVYDTYAPSTHRPARWTVVGGTSASAPFIGGLFARAGDLAAVDGPRTLYAAPRSDYTDVTDGATFGQLCTDYRGVSDRLCEAGPGWDGPTGLGTPLGLAVFRPSTSTAGSSTSRGSRS